MEFRPQIKTLVTTYNQNTHFYNNMIYWLTAMFVKHVKCEHKIREKTTFGKCSITSKVDPCLIFSFNIACTHNDTR